MICLTHSGDLRKDSPTGLQPHEHAVDLGISLDFEGGLAICETCLVEMASLLGMQTSASVSELTAAFKADRDWEAAHRENAERDLKSALDAVQGMQFFQKFRMITPAEEPDESNILTFDSEPVKRGPGRPRKTVE